MKNILFIQFTNKIFNYDPIVKQQLKTFYKNNYKNGYKRLNQVLEIPKWIAEASYFITGNKKLHWCDNIETTIKFINNENPTYVLFSLLTCSKNFIYKIVKTCSKTKFIIGGYDLDALEKLQKLKNVKVVHNMKDVAVYLKDEYKYGTDYSLFANVNTIPRLTMSKGCSHNCKFCTVPHKEVIPIKTDYILQQATSFAILNFKLVYIDDKTFGQCQNFELLKTIYKVIKMYNKQFKGFIIQTTAKEFIKKQKLFAELHVIVAEVGFETYNNYILKKYNKPINEATINKCIKEANEIKLIPNLIIGFPEETNNTYKKTYEYIKLHKHKFLGINLAIFTDYNDITNAGELDFAHNNKYDLHKKWWDKFNEL